MPIKDRKQASVFIAPEAIAGGLAALGIPIAVVFGQLLLVALLAFIMFGVFLRFKRKKLKQAKSR